MSSKNTAITTQTVSPGSDIYAELPAKGVMRFERQDGAMAGNPDMAIENDTLALKFADGTSLYVKMA